MKKNLF